MKQHTCHRTPNLPASLVAALSAIFIASCQPATSTQEDSIDASLTSQAPCTPSKSIRCPMIHRGGTEETKHHPVKVVDGADENMTIFDSKGGTVTWRYELPIGQQFWIFYKGKQPCTGECQWRSSGTGTAQSITHVVQKYVPTIKAGQDNEYHYVICIPHPRKRFVKFCLDPVIIVQDPGLGE